MPKLVFEREWDSQPQYPVAFADASAVGGVAFFGVTPTGIEGRNQFVATRANGAGISVSREGPGLRSFRIGGTLLSAPGISFPSTKWNQNSFTVRALMSVRGPLEASNAYVLFTSDSGSGSLIKVQVTEGATSTRLELNAATGYGAVLSAFIDYTTPQQLSLFEFDFDGTTGRIFRDGLLIASAAKTAALATLTAPVQIIQDLGAYVVSQQTLYVQLLNGVLGGKTSNPWQIFEPEVVATYFSASGAAALAGTAAGVATAAGALTTAIRLLGNASGIATASGSLLDPIPLAGSAVSVANATGAITAQISLSGAAIALAAAFGNITAQITLAGNAQDVATAVGDLTAFGSGLSGAAQGLASGSGVLTAQIKLAANASAIATAVGGMTTGIPLSGAMVAISSATGALTISVVLSGAAVAQAIASGALTAQINLSGAALGVAIAAAYLGTSAALNGAAASIASAAGVLENYIDAVTLVSAYSSNVGLVSTPDSVALRHYR